MENFKKLYRGLESRARLTMQTTSSILHRVFHRQQKGSIDKHRLVGCNIRREDSGNVLSKRGDHETVLKTRSLPIPVDKSGSKLLFKCDALDWALPATDDERAIEPSLPVSQTHDDGDDVTCNPNCSTTLDVVFNPIESAKANATTEKDVVCNPIESAKANATTDRTQQG